jgi:hypothetical protein
MKAGFEFWIQRVCDNLPHGLILSTRAIQVESSLLPSAEPGLSVRRTVQRGSRKENET